MEAASGKGWVGRLTKEEAQAFKRRWQAVNAAEKEELASTPGADKFRQVAALLASAVTLGATGAEGEELVRSVGPAYARNIMVEPTELVPLLAVLWDLVGWWKAGKVPGVVIGGLAASLLGRPRLTRGVDALVLVE